MSYKKEEWLIEPIDKHNFEILLNDWTRIAVVKGKANAERIAQCVNSHDKLIKVLKQITTEILTEKEIQHLAKQTMD